MLGRLERAVERIVDGGIASAFRLRVQPAEIGRQLERAMLDGRTASVGSTLAPNAYEVRLHPEDAEPFRNWQDALSREMELWLAEIAFAKGFGAVGPFRVRVVEDPVVCRRSVCVAARFEAGSAAPRPPRWHDGGSQSVLHLIPAGPADRRVALMSGYETVGRAADNTVVLDHREVSRYHARIEHHGAGWRVVDLGSSNGTWVNGERIEESELVAGDEITFGGICFSIEVG